MTQIQTEYYRTPDISFMKASKAAEVMEIIEDTLHICGESASRIFCHSKVFKNIFDEKTKEYETSAEELATQFFKEIDADSTLMDRMYDDNVIVKF